MKFTYIQRLGILQIAATAYLRIATESQRPLESICGQTFKKPYLALMGSGQVAEAEAYLCAALEQLQTDLLVYCLRSEI